MSQPSDPSTAPTTYPPENHITNDLSPRIEREDGGATILLPIVPELHDAGGRLRVGVAATIVDIVAGETAIRAVLPQWIATSSLSLQIGAMPGDGTLRARPRVLRQGKTTLVEEVVLDHVETNQRVGLSTITFSILPGLRDSQTRAHWAAEPEPVSQLGRPDSGLERPLLEALGIDPDPSDASVLRAPMSDYVVNTLGAMQGGVVAMLIDAAADQHASATLGTVTRVRSAEIHYLKLARVGPIRATARTVGTLEGGLLIHVELRDEGRDDMLLTVANVVAERA